MKRYSCDVLVIGGGGAALRAAIAAKEKDRDCRVLLVTKGKLGTTGTTANSCSDRMAFHATLEHTEPLGSDAWKYHADDIYRIGGEVSDYDLAATLAKGANEAFHYLQSLGVPFAMKGDKPDQFVTDGSMYARACYTGPRTAIHIEEALLRRFKELDIDLLENSMIFRLVVKDSTIQGALGINENDELVAADSKAVVLATGGGGEAYRYNVYPSGAAGDGYILALDCGAQLVNMEFIQIGLSNPQTKFACSGSLMRAVPRLVNDRGEEFLSKYFSSTTSLGEIFNIEFEKGASWPVSCEHASSHIDVAVYKENAAGRRVFMDFSKNPCDFSFNMMNESNSKRYESEIKTVGMVEKRDDSPLLRLQEINPPSIKWLKERGIDLEKGDLLEIVPAIQHFQGGVKINPKAETCVKGLYAAGECAGGQHGANRPGGNALMDCQVFGRIAGEEAAGYAYGTRVQGITEETVSSAANEIEGIKEKSAGTAAELFKGKIQDQMKLYASIVRTAEGVRTAVDELNMLDIRDMTANSAYEYFEVKNIFSLAKVVLAAIGQRMESRGPHLFFRCMEDLNPVSGNPDYRLYFVISKDGNKLKIERKIPVRNAEGG